MPSLLLPQATLGFRTRADIPFYRAAAVDVSQPSPRAFATSGGVSKSAKVVLTLPRLAIAPTPHAQGHRPMIISILTRRLKEGKTYEDFRAAWKPDKGFGVNTRVVSCQSLDDPREIVTIGFSDLSPEQ